MVSWESIKERLLLRRHWQLFAVNRSWWRWRISQPDIFHISRAVPSLPCCHAAFWRWFWRCCTNRRGSNAIRQFLPEFSGFISGKANRRLCYPYVSFFLNDETSKIFKDLDRWRLDCKLFCASWVFDHELYVKLCHSISLRIFCTILCRAKQTYPHSMREYLLYSSISWAIVSEWRFAALYSDQNTVQIC